MGLVVTWLYSLLSEQALPHLRIASFLLHDYWPWLGAGLLALTTVSIVAERAHWQHEARAPQPLLVRRRLWWERLRGQTSAVVSPVAHTSTMVGRTTELAKLNDYLAQVKAETRRVVFVSWEPAIGKTTLVRAFLDSLAADRTVRIGRGQCVEQYGAGEPYMLMPETLTRLCRSPTVSSYRRFCIGWRQPELAQMPSLVSAEDRFRLQTLAQGTTQQRIMR